MTLIDHALNEFRAAKWLDSDGKYCDEMQEDICKHVLNLLQVFSDEGHSGSTAPYTVNVFSKLAMFEPLVPLTGEDWEWHEVDNGMLQNRRCGHVFKENGKAFDVQGIIFQEDHTDPETGETFTTSFTSYKSRVDVTFPYTPTRTYVKVDKDGNPLTY